MTAESFIVWSGKDGMMMVVAVRAEESSGLHNEMFSSIQKYFRLVFLVAEKLMLLASSTVEYYLFVSEVQ